MRSHVKKAAFLAAILGLAAPALAQTAGGGGGGTGTSSTSPGETPQGETETGVGAPGDAPADNRTLEPVNPKDQSSTGSTANDDTSKADRDAKRRSHRASKSGAASSDESGSYSHEQQKQ